MSTSELERRLGDMLQRHAEDAMNGTNTEEELERLQDDTGRSTRRRRRAWIAGGLVAARCRGRADRLAAGPGLGQGRPRAR